MDNRLFSLLLAIRDRQDKYRTITKIFVLSPVLSEPLQMLGSLSPRFQLNSVSKRASNGHLSKQSSSCSQSVGKTKLLRGVHMAYFRCLQPGEMNYSQGDPALHCEL